MDDGLTRRTLLAGLCSAIACEGSGALEDPPGTLPGAPPGGCCAPGTPPTEPWALSGLLDEVAFPSGLRGGDPGPDGLVLSGRTLEPGVVLSGAAARGGRWVALPGRGPLVPVGGFVRIEVDGLEPDTEHAFALVSMDGLRRSALGTYRTAPAPDTERVVCLGATSCLGNAEPTLPLLWAAAADDLDAFLILGDAIYTQATTLSGYRGAYTTLLARDSFRALATATPLVVMWDDHEVADNWIVGPGPPGQIPIPSAQLRAARIAFCEALPQRIGADGVGLWRSLRFGRTLELILLDARAERTETSIVSTAQLGWAIETLRASTCRFKLVVTGVHLTDHALRLSFPNNTDDTWDRWQGYPEQRSALLAACEEVPGVAIVSGDMHYGGIQRVGAPGEVGAGLWGVAAGPAGSRPWDLAGWLAEQGHPADAYDVLIDTYSYARFRADPGAGELTVELVDAAGRVLAARTLLRV